MKEEQLSEEQKTLLMINGYIDESQKTGFASITTHALNVIKLRYTKLVMHLTEKLRKHALCIWQLMTIRLAYVIH